MGEVIITETPRVLLRQFEVRDVQAMSQVLCDPEVMMFSRGAKKRTEVRAWIEGCTEDYSKLGFGLWAVVLKDTNDVIGYLGLTLFPDMDGQAETEIGFRLERRVWFRGYATESAAAVRDYAFHTLGLSRLIALVDPDNTASIHVVEKVGMICEKEVMLPWYERPDRLYAITQSKGSDSKTDSGDD